MAVSGSGIFFDGRTSDRRPVVVELEPAALTVRGLDHDLLAKWPYGELQEIYGPPGVLRVGRAGSPLLARLEVRDAALAAAIDDLSLPVDRSGRTERRGRLKVTAWTVAAMASLVVVAVYGVPAVADRLAPLVPASVERKLGDAVNLRVRAIVDFSRDGKTLECGLAPGEKAGRAAFEKLMGRLETAASLPVRIDALVIRRDQANAFAIPGGHIYVFQGLIGKTENPDELAGVIAHEMGHVANRDGMRSIIQAAGLSFMFGMLLGDFVGGSAAVIAANRVLKSSYSREVETAADLYSVALMTKINANPRALAAILTRISGAIEPGMQILLDHPDTKSRVRLIEAAVMPPNRVALLSAAEWSALKGMCGGG